MLNRRKREAAPVRVIEPATADPTAADPSAADPPSDPSALLSVRNLDVSFPTDDGLVTAVRNVSFDLHAGEALGVVGESGSGKSVAAMALMGLLPRNTRLSGSVGFDGREVVGMSEKELEGIRGRGIAMIFQDPMTALNPVRTVGHQLAEAYLVHNSGSKTAVREKVIETLRAVGIPQPDRRARQYPHEYSGGMRQRAMIAMAVINHPKLVIADEPTTALDVTVQAQILETLQVLQHTTDTAIMFITHDLAVVATVTDRVQVMYAGTVVETGAVHDVLRTPKHPYTAGLIASIPETAGVGHRLRPIPGSPPSLINIAPGCTFSPRCPLVREDCLQAEPALEPAGRVGQRARCYHSDEVHLIHPQADARTDIRRRASTEESE